MSRKLNVPELVIIVMVIVIIFASEYTFVVLNNPTRAIFIGLWPPTIMLMLIYFNMKFKT